MSKCGLVSIVLPIYNVEKYLDRCIESVVNQTYKDLEIILVDDGSLDGCPKKCEEWAKKDKRIKVIHKENAGLGMARNTGIENATGEYICFFDSDDYIKNNAVEHAYNLAKKVNADIVTYGVERVDGNGRTIQTLIPTPQKLLYTGSEVQTEYLPNLIGPDAETGNNINIKMSAWTSLYSLEMINKANWRFVSERDIISEDIYSLLILFKYVNKIAILQECLYFYCDNPSSLTHTFQKDRFERNKNFYYCCRNKCKELNYNENVVERLAHPYLANTIAAMKMDVKMEGVKAISDFKLLVNDDLMVELVNKSKSYNGNIRKNLFYFCIKHKMYRVAFLLVCISVL